MIFTAVFLHPLLQTNIISDPLQAFLDKYGLPTFCVLVLIGMARYVIVQTTKQNNARIEADRVDRERAQETQTKHDKLQDEIRIQFADQNAESKTREIKLHEQLEAYAETVAGLRVDVAILQEQAKNYDDRIGFLKLQLQVKQSEFEQAEVERRKLKDRLDEVIGQLTAVEHAYQLLREEHDRLVLENNAVAADVGNMKRDTQSIQAVPQPEGIPHVG